jgi:hypothetical protein
VRHLAVSRSATRVFSLPLLESRQCVVHGLSDDYECLCHGVGAIGFAYWRGAYLLYVVASLAENPREIRITGIFFIFLFFLFSLYATLLRVRTSYRISYFHFPSETPKVTSSFSIRRVGRGLRGEFRNALCKLSFMAFGGGSDD